MPGARTSLSPCPVDGACAHLYWPGVGHVMGDFFHREFILGRGFFLLYEGAAALFFLAVATAVDPFWIVRSA